MSTTNRMVAGYELLERIGSGDEGLVYKARCVTPANPSLQVGDAVVIKARYKLGDAPEGLEPLHRLVETMRTFPHPNVIAYKDGVVLDETAGPLACIVAEHLTGETLRQRLTRQRGGLPWEDVSAIFRACAEALTFVNGCGIWHRVLTPSQIFLLADGTVKVAGFDMQGWGSPDEPVAREESYVLDYLAPEFATVPDFKGNERSQVFSFAVCLYEALTGELPFEPPLAGSFEAYLQRWRGAEPPLPRAVHGIFRVLLNSRNFLETALLPEPEKRHATLLETTACFKSLRYRIIRHKDAEEYKLVDVIGRGGYGIVYRALRQSDGRAVAFKHLSIASGADRFKREAKLLSATRHPNVVEFMDFFSIKSAAADEQMFLVMELLEGMPDWALTGRIKAAGAGLDVDEMVPLFVGYLNGLQYLHDQHIIHRDIKPGNLYAPRGHPQGGKLIDLGVARDVSGTQTGGIVPGTWDYMAPEFFSDPTQRGSPASDLYALGLALYEAVVGLPALPRLPLADREAIVELVNRIKKPTPIDFSHAVFQEYPWLAAIVRRCLERDRRRRYQAADDMRVDLQAGLASGQMPAKVTEFPTRPSGAGISAEFTTPTMPPMERPAQTPVLPSPPLTHVSGTPVPASPPPARRGAGSGWLAAAACAAAAAGGGYWWTTHRGGEAPVKQPTASVRVTNGIEVATGGAVVPPSATTAGVTNGFVAKPQPPPPETEPLELPAPVVVVPAVTAEVARVVPPPVPTPASPATNGPAAQAERLLVRIPVKPGTNGADFAALDVAARAYTNLVATTWPPADAGQRSTQLAALSNALANAVGAWLDAWREDGLRQIRAGGEATGALQRLTDLPRTAPTLARLAGARPVEAGAALRNLASARKAFSDALAGLRADLARAVPLEQHAAHLQALARRLADARGRDWREVTAAERDEKLALLDRQLQQAVVEHFRQLSDAARRVFDQRGDLAPWQARLAQLNAGMPELVALAREDYQRTVALFDGWTVGRAAFESGLQELIRVVPNDPRPEAQRLQAAFAGLQRLRGRSWTGLPAEERDAQLRKADDALQSRATRELERLRDAAVSAARQGATGNPARDALRGLPADAPDVVRVVGDAYKTALAEVDALDLGGRLVAAIRGGERTCAVPAGAPVSQAAFDGLLEQAAVVRAGLELQNCFVDDKPIQQFVAAVGSLWTAAQGVEAPLGEQVRAAVWDVIHAQLVTQAQWTVSAACMSRSPAQQTVTRHEFLTMLFRVQASTERVAGLTETDPLRQTVCQLCHPPFSRAAIFEFSPAEQAGLAALPWLQAEVARMELANGNGRTEAVTGESAGAGPADGQVGKAL